ncbi:MAG: diaminopimelate epimerase [Candidatus Omnitrophica bacterium]|nr:diaminopimelate epimerase [Candidatus Omnitrophota bacterium]MCM8806377.1 diaminopimelate epimerase [Candidatus Omnitrophota bacterium]
MEFFKIVGSGNDFIIIDNRENKIKNRKNLALKLCDRKFGIGADGLLFLEKSTIADFKMRIFNPDGSEAEMCGNGLRCILRYIYEKNLSRKKKLIIETKAGVLDGEIKGRKIKVRIKVIEKPKLNIEISINGEKITGNFINTGVPHTVIFVDNVERIDLNELGPKIRFNKIFSPEGTNVDWVEISNNRSSIKIRTYERGVEGETLSCGTGAVASALISSLLFKISSPINVITKSKEVLKVYFDKNFENVYLEGDTFFAFKGFWIER